MSLLFATAEFLNVLFLIDIHKLWQIIGTLSLSFTSRVSKMDKSSLRSLRIYDFVGSS